MIKSRFALMFGALCIGLLFTFVPRFVDSQEEQQIDMEAVQADEAFMTGVRAYHSGEFGSSVLLFERSLSFKPERFLTRLWLGNSYYRSGLLDSALEQWRTVMDSESATSSLANLLESIEYRRSLGPELSPETRFVEVNQLEGSSDEYTIFLGPTSVLSRPDGGNYIVSFASNEVVSVSINGMVRERIRGGFAGLNRPFDILAGSDGRLYISEYQGDRIVSMNSSGTDIQRFGGKGRGDGFLLGPQYLAMDNQGSLYVSEQGNRRVSKFDRDGNFLLSFGSRTRDFSGFREPTGIVFLDDVLYVADGRQNIIFRFDTSGNYIGRSASGLFEGLEGLSLVDHGKFLVADRQGIHLFDPESEVSRKLVNARSDSRFIKATFDVNGNLIVADFSDNSIYRYTDFHQLYGSLLVEVDRVMEERFPRLAVAATVTSRNGDPLLGLELNNFLVTEGRIEARDISFAGSIDQLDQAMVAIVAERSPETVQLLPAFSDAVSALGTAASGRFEFSFTGGGEIPVREVSSTFSADPLIEALLQGTSTVSPQWEVDSAIRLAASGLTAANRKRAVVLFSSGKVPPDGFDRYELVEMARYLETNYIAFFCVLPSKAAVPEEYRYLAEFTGGKVYHLFQPEGIAPLADSILDRRDGRYVLEFTSSLDDDFGRRFLPVEVQAYIHGRSGRGESGYYAPLR
jgi:hypothetical protein